MYDESVSESACDASQDGESRSRPCGGGRWPSSRSQRARARTRLPPRTVANEHELALSVRDVVLLDDVSVHRRGVLYHCGKRRMLQ